MGLDPAEATRVLPILWLCIALVGWPVWAVRTRKRRKSYGPVQRARLNIWRAMYLPMMLLILVSAIANSCVPDKTAILLGGLESLAACVWLGVFICLLAGPWGAWFAEEMKEGRAAWVSPRKYAYFMMLPAGGILLTLLRAATYLLSVWLALD